MVRNIQPGFRLSSRYGSQPSPQVNTQNTYRPRTPPLYNQPAKRFSNSPSFFGEIGSLYDWEKIWTYASFAPLVWIALMVLVRPSNRYVTGVGTFILSLPMILKYLCSSFLHPFLGLGLVWVLLASTAILCNCSIDEAIGEIFAIPHNIINTLTLDYCCSTQRNRRKALASQKEQEVKRQAVQNILQGNQAEPQGSRLSHPQSPTLSRNTGQTSGSNTSNSNPTNTTAMTGPTNSVAVSSKVISSPNSNSNPSSTANSSASPKSPSNALHNTTNVDGKEAPTDTNVVATASSPLPMQDGAQRPVSPITSSIRSTSEKLVERIAKIRSPTSDMSDIEVEKRQKAITALHTGSLFIDQYEALDTTALGASDGDAVSTSTSASPPDQPVNSVHSSVPWMMESIRLTSSGYTSGSVVREQNSQTSPSREATTFVSVDLKFSHSELQRLLSAEKSSSTTSNAMKFVKALISPLAEGKSNEGVGISSKTQSTDFSSSNGKDPTIKSPNGENIFDRMKNLFFCRRTQDQRMSKNSKTSQTPFLEPYHNPSTLKHVTLRNENRFPQQNSVFSPLPRLAQGLGDLSEENGDGMKVSPSLSPSPFAETKLRFVVHQFSERPKKHEEVAKALTDTLHIPLSSAEALVKGYCPLEKMTHYSRFSGLKSQEIAEKMVQKLPLVAFVDEFTSRNTLRALSSLATEPYQAISHFPDSGLSPESLAFRDLHQISHTYSFTETVPVSTFLNNGTVNVEAKDSDSDSDVRFSIDIHPQTVCLAVLVFQVESQEPGLLQRIHPSTPKALSEVVINANMPRLRSSVQILDNCSRHQLPSGPRVVSPLSQNEKTNNYGSDLSPGQGRRTPSSSMVQRLRHRSSSQHRNANAEDTGSSSPAKKGKSLPVSFLPPSNMTLLRKMLMKRMTGNSGKNDTAQNQHTTGQSSSNTETTVKTPDFLNQRLNEIFARTPISLVSRSSVCAALQSFASLARHHGGNFMSNADRSSVSRSSTVTRLHLDTHLQKMLFSPSVMQLTSHWRHSTVVVRSIASVSSHLVMTPPLTGNLSSFFTPTEISSDVLSVLDALVPLVKGLLSERPPMMINAQSTVMEMFSAPDMVSEPHSPSNSDLDQRQRGVYSQKRQDFIEQFLNAKSKSKSNVSISRVKESAISRILWSQEKGESDIRKLRCLTKALPLSPTSSLVSHQHHQYRGSSGSSESMTSPTESTGPTSPRDDIITSGYYDSALLVDTTPASYPRVNLFDSIFFSWIERKTSAITTLCNLFELDLSNSVLKQFEREIRVKDPEKLTLFKLQASQIAFEYNIELLQRGILSLAMCVLLQISDVMVLYDSILAVIAETKKSDEDSKLTFQQRLSTRMSVINPRESIRSTFPRLHSRLSSPFSSSENSILSDSLSQEDPTHQDNTLDWSDFLNNTSSPYGSNENGENSVLRVATQFAKTGSDELTLLNQWKDVLLALDYCSDFQYILQSVEPLIESFHQLWNLLAARSVSSLSPSGDGLSISHLPHQVVTTIGSSHFKQIDLNSMSSYAYFRSALGDTRNPALRVHSSLSPLDVPVLFYLPYQAQKMSPHAQPDLPAFPDLQKWEERVEYLDSLFCIGSILYLHFEKKGSTLRSEEGKVLLLSSKLQSTAKLLQCIGIDAQEIDPMYLHLEKDQILKFFQHDNFAKTLRLLFQAHSRHMGQLKQQEVLMQVSSNPTHHGQVYPPRTSRATMDPQRSLSNPRRDLSSAGLARRNSSSSERERERERVPTPHRQASGHGASYTEVPISATTDTNYDRVRRSRESSPGHFTFRGESPKSSYYHLHRPSSRPESRSGIRAESRPNTRPPSRSSSHSAYARSNYGRSTSNSPVTNRFESGPDSDSDTNFSSTARSRSREALRNGHWSRSSSIEPKSRPSSSHSRMMTGRITPAATSTTPGQSSLQSQSQSKLNKTTDWTANVTRRTDNAQYGSSPQSSNLTTIWSNPLKTFPTNNSPDVAKSYSYNHQQQQQQQTQARTQTEAQAQARAQPQSQESAQLSSQFSNPVQNVNAQVPTIYRKHFFSTQPLPSSIQLSSDEVSPSQQNHAKRAENTVLPSYNTQLSEQKPKQLTQPESVSQPLTTRRSVLIPPVIRAPSNVATNLLASSTAGRVSHVNPPTMSLSSTSPVSQTSTSSSLRTSRSPSSMVDKTNDERMRQNSAPRAAQDPVRRRSSRLAEMAINYNEKEKEKQKGM